MFGHEHGMCSTVLHFAFFLFQPFLPTGDQKMHKLLALEQYYLCDLFYMKSATVNFTNAKVAMS